MNYSKNEDQKLTSLKSEIQKGIDSGQSKPLDMKAIITQAKSCKR